MATSIDKSSPLWRFRNSGVSRFKVSGRLTHNRLPSVNPIWSDAKHCLQWRYRLPFDFGRDVRFYVIGLQSTSEKTRKMKQNEEIKCVSCVRVWIFRIVVVVVNAFFFLLSVRFSFIIFYILYKIYIYAMKSIHCTGYQGCTLAVYVISSEELHVFARHLLQWNVLIIRSLHIEYTII